MKKGKVLLASLSGSVIEWYDFYLYGTATALVFSTLFFPSHDPAISILIAFATFGAGYAARPIGSIIFGHIGDRVGRKASLMMTLIGMGGSSFLIGLLPTYAQVGVLAPALLVILRLIQGVSLGGEWGGAVLLATESAGKGLRGLFGSIPQLGVPIGLVLGTFSFTVISAFTTEAQFMAWGWRIPFLFSAVLIVLAIWIRSTIEETPEFQKKKESGDIAKIPVADLFRNNKKDLFRIIGLKLGDGFFNVFLMSFILVYATTYVGYTRDQALLALTLSCATMIITIPIVGYLSDFIGRKNIYIAGLVAMVALAIPYFLMIPVGNGWFLTMQIILLGVIWASIFSTQGTFFSELFPANVRYTGLSLGYQVAAAIVGFGPMLWTTMADHYGAAPYVFGGFMIGGLLLSLCLSIFSPDTRKVTRYEEPVESEETDSLAAPAAPSPEKQLNY
ncbi:MFS transporter [Edaphobacillus lindanitolerans]|uniref:Putative proline/betaine transporter n=1 Tax=Edaphobacillus lindanitolerans TaxID=550447 RepID=A0A1U7PIB0_9BACI|nr:MFS transporter [Edaphobacillus lindanitolerans]SIT72686.1 Predicted arabinose efflux permease, MFS family [Edaphobacillus lindanitolerans]